VLTMKWISTPSAIKQFLYCTALTTKLCLEELFLKIIFLVFSVLNVCSCKIKHSHKVLFKNCLCICFDKNVSNLFSMCQFFNHLKNILNTTIMWGLDHMLLHFFALHTIILPLTAISSNWGFKGCKRGWHTFL